MIIGSFLSLDSRHSSVAPSFLSQSTLLNTSCVAEEHERELFPIAPERESLKTSGKIVLYIEKMGMFFHILNIHDGRKLSRWSTTFVRHKHLDMLGQGGDW